MNGRKLSPADCIQVRKLYRGTNCEPVTAARIAQRFGVSERQVRKVVAVSKREVNSKI